MLAPSAVAQSPCRLLLYARPPFSLPLSLPPSASPPPPQTHSRHTPAPPPTARVIAAMGDAPSPDRLPEIPPRASPAGPPRALSLRRLRRRRRQLRPLTLPRLVPRARRLGRAARLVESSAPGAGPHNLDSTFSCAARPPVVEGGQSDTLEPGFPAADQAMASASGPWRPPHMARRAGEGARHGALVAHANPALLAQKQQAVNSATLNVGMAIICLAQPRLPAESARPPSQDGWRASCLFG